MARTTQDLIGSFDLKMQTTRCIINLKIVFILCSRLFNVEVDLWDATKNKIINIEEAPARPIMSSAGIYFFFKLISQGIDRPHKCHCAPELLRRRTRALLLDAPQAAQTLVQIDRGCLRLRWATVERGGQPASSRWSLVLLVESLRESS